MMITYSLSFTVGGKLHSLLNTIVGRLHLRKSLFSVRLRRAK